MPKYAFACTCGLRFDRVLRIGDHPTHECPACFQAADRDWSSEGFAFGFQANPNSAQGNTGVHKEDYPTADQVVGRDAEAKREHYKARDKVKEEARAGGGTRKLRRQDGDGFIDYTTLTVPEQGARRKLARRMISEMEKQKTEKDTNPS